MLELLLSLTALLFVIRIVIYYINNKEALTGNYYVRRPIGFVNPYIMVEYKKGRKKSVRKATAKDIQILRNKFEIEHF